MRTVSFSQPRICQILQHDFVCFHTSTEGDPSAGQSIRHRPNDPAGTCIRGNGPQNVQTLFLTPEGQIFHAVSGYVPPDELEQELKFARDLFDALKLTGPDAPEKRQTTVVDRHRQRLIELGFSAEEAQPPAGRNDATTGSAMESVLQQAARVSGGVLPDMNPAGNPFDFMIRSQVLTDHRFCMRHPLMESREFERDPTPLVGSGKSFFMSSSGGN